MDYIAGLATDKLRDDLEDMFPCLPPFTIDAVIAHAYESARYYQALEQQLNLRARTTPRSIAVRLCEAIWFGVRFPMPDGVDKDAAWAD